MTDLPPSPPAPFVSPPLRVTADTWVLPTWIPIPTFGWLPSNAFLVRAAEPVLVDTGLFATCDAFVDALERIIEPPDLRWIFLTHVDPDHIGALDALLARAPRARVVTTFLGLAKLNLRHPYPPDRVRLMNPGETLDLGDRVMHALQPPTFDAPETTALFDRSSRALFSSDCFGGAVPQPVDSAYDIPPDTLRAGMHRWAVVDAPWVRWLTAEALAERLKPIAEMEPALVLSTHLPPARGLNQALLDNLAAAREAPAWMGPDQAAFEAMTAGAPS